MEIQKVEEILQQPQQQSPQPQQQSPQPQQQSPQQQKDNKKILQHCDYCNFDAHSPTEWFKHVETKKHLRKGTKICDNLKCEICGLVSVNSYNLNIHRILVHATSEERKAGSKFYCDTCDTGFFCKLYYDRHMISKKHLNMVKYKEMIAQNT
jgi:hypothetical protein